jgi:hypothetical protein
MAKRPAVSESEIEAEPDLEPDDALIARVLKRRRAGDGHPDDVQELLSRAAEENRAALDRLAE